MIWKPSAGLPHIKIVVGMVLFLFVYLAQRRMGALHRRLFPRQGLATRRPALRGTSANACSTRRYTGAGSTVAITEESNQGLTRCRNGPLHRAIGEGGCPSIDDETGSRR